jgi:hypothetical protein
MNKILLFSAFLEYEKRHNPALLASVGRAFTIPLKILCNFCSFTELYYYEGSSKALIVSDRRYMLSSSLMALAGSGYHLITKEKLLQSDTESITLAKRASWDDLLWLVSYVRQVDLSFSRRLALLASALDYLPITNFNALLTKQFRHINEVVCNDPSSPFVRNIINLGLQNNCRLVFLCETRVAEYSTEWLEFEPHLIYALEGREQGEQLKKHLGIDSTPFKERHSVLKDQINSPSYEYSILFFQQYYHPLAFKSRVRHLMANLQIAKRPSVLMRLHPNELLFEKSLYQLLGLLGIVNLSVHSIEEDITLCRFAISYTSTAIEYFRQRTARPAKYLKSNNLVCYQ